MILYLAERSGSLARRAWQALSISAFSRLNCASLGVAFEQGRPAGAFAVLEGEPVDGQFVHLVDRIGFGVGARGYWRPEQEAGPGRSLSLSSSQ